MTHYRRLTCRGRGRIIAAGSTPRLSTSRAPLPRGFAFSGCPDLLPGEQQEHHLDPAHSAQVKLRLDAAPLRPARELQRGLLVSQSFEVPEPEKLPGGFVVSAGEDVRGER